MPHTKPRRHTDPELLSQIRQIRCAACGGEPPNEAHHVKTRGAMGGDDPWNVIPLCVSDHRLWHQYGPSKFFKHRPDCLDVLLYMQWEWDGKKLTHPKARKS